MINFSPYFSGEWIISIKILLKTFDKYSNFLVHLVFDFLFSIVLINDFLSLFYNFQNYLQRFSFDELFRNLFCDDWRLNAISPKNISKCSCLLQLRIGQLIRIALRLICVIFVIIGIIKIYLRLFVLEKLFSESFVPS